MSKSNTWETDLLNLLFTNAAATGIGDAGGLLPSASAGSLYMSLHTADPGEAGAQNTSEVTYTSYARVAIARTSGAFTVSGNAVSLAANVTFPAGTGGSGTAAFWGIGTAASGAGKLLYKGAISPSIVTGNGVTPILDAGALVTEE